MKKFVIGTFVLIGIFLLLRGQPFYSEAIKTGVNGWRKIWGGLVNL